MSAAGVQSSPKVVDPQASAAGGASSRVQSVSVGGRRTSGRIQQQQHRRSNGASTVACASGGTGNLGGKDNKKGGAGGGRKRSHSFSGGGGAIGAGGGANGPGGGGIGGGGGGKMFPSYKRRKKDTPHIIPPTKFLLGGNICDPLNLNSLLDEDINRAMNAVTPRSSPLPTPKHRKGKVQVLIPPNPNDPLNLLQMSTDGDAEGDAEYEASLISPVKGGGGGGGGACYQGAGLGGGSSGKRNKRKRRHTKSFSGGGSDEACCGGVQAATGGGGREGAVEAEMEAASLSRRQQARANLRLDLEGSGEQLKMAHAVGSGSASSNNSIVAGADEVGSPAPTTPNCQQQIGSCAAEPQSATSSAAADSAAAALVTSSAATKPMTSSGGAPTKAMTSSAVVGSSVSHPVKKFRKESKDKIVSPAIPQPGAWGDKSHHHHHHHHRYRGGGGGGGGGGGASHLVTPHIDKNQKTPNFKEVNTRFRYGNYNRYYGYRNPASGGGHQQQGACPSGSDPRLRVLLRRRDLFESRDVLDIGCNVGHVTLALARDLNPRQIVGVDIDRKLVEAARRNVKHYVGGCGGGGGRKLPYPSAMPVMYGPLDAPPVAVGGDCGGSAEQHQRRSRFPFNVSFVQGNYVLDSDAQLSVEERCQFDTIVCLSVTKWFHLNWGDAGLKRAFRRMYAQLRPGGKLILEPQPWHSYKKKRNLTPEIWHNYKSIELFPHKFSQFLLSEVGFTKCEVVGTPHHHAKGFQRPIKLFTKGESSSAPCSVRTSNDDVTSLMTTTTAEQRLQGVTSSLVVVAAAAAAEQRLDVTSSERQAVESVIQQQQDVTSSERQTVESVIQQQQDVTASEQQECVKQQQDVTSSEQKCQDVTSSE